MCPKHCLLLVYGGGGGGEEDPKHCHLLVYGGRGGGSKTLIFWFMCRGREESQTLSSFGLCVCVCVKGGGGGNPLLSLVYVLLNPKRRAIPKMIDSCSKKDTTLITVQCLQTWYDHVKLVRGYHYAELKKMIQ